MEIWKDIIGWEGLYKVSNLGRIMSKRNHIIKPRYIKSHSGHYLAVDLHNKSIRKTLLVHRIVAINFIPNPKNKPQVDHINRIVEDNRVENLRWATNKEQQFNTRRIQLW